MKASEINNTSSKNVEDIYNKSIKSMLNDIQNLNSDISFKLKIIEQQQQSNKLKYKLNQNNKIGLNQCNSINNIKNTNTSTGNHLIIPNNNNCKTKNIIRNLFQKNNEKNIHQIRTIMANRSKILKFNNSSSKKLKNIPSVGNIKNSKINNSNNNANNSKLIKNIEIKNKNENRTKSTITRNVNPLPRSAKSRTNSKNTNKDESMEKYGKIQEVIKKAKFEENSIKARDENKNK